MNIDNYPTHVMKDSSGEQKEYCAASKHWKLTDPACSSMKSLHYAGEDRVYLIVRNKYTSEWEFPVHNVYVGQTFFKAKLNLFEELTNNKWRIKFFGSSPILHTLREFTPIEQENPMNQQLKGVRTFWFGAHHLRGVPEMVMDSVSDENSTSMYNDWLWVPKRQLNEYLARDYYEIFSTVAKTR